MPRTIRKRTEAVYDAATEAMNYVIALCDRLRLGRPGMTREKLAAEKAARGAEFERRLSNARRRWDLMTPTERTAWGDDYLREQRERHVSSPALPRREAELRDLFAVSRVADRDARRYVKQSQKEAAKRQAADERRRADIDAQRARAATETPAESATRPRAAMEAARAGQQTQRPRRRRRLPREITQLPDGRFVNPIYDDDDR